MNDAERRFCPLHGEYVPDGRETACPRCQEDPIASTASLRRVRVVNLHEEEEERADESLREDITPFGETANCPVCGKGVLLGEFREEAIGEVWTGQAAVWAEEGVCADCHREVLPAYIRAWTPGEWLAHHLEGWRTNLERVHKVVVYEHNPSESWLSDEDRLQLVDVGATLEKRREHLARCSATARELVQKYGADGVPAAFQSALESAASAVAKDAIEDLRRARELGLEDERARRQHSIEERAPTLPLAPPPPTPWTDERLVAIPDAKAAGVRRPSPLLIAAAVLVVAFILAFLLR